ncbi:restriction endonuclease subunit S [Desulfosarcina sp. OttesenSCG-928-G10]|nr:restriction endonuclease subunit S [Desulfosarcina sp. OttesenSCG-928-G10]
MTRKLGDLCLCVGGGTPSKDCPEYYTGSIPWATVRDLKNDYLESTEFNITNDALAQSSSNIISRGNVIIATRVGLGKVSIAAMDTAINQDLKGIIPRKTSTLLPKFLFYWFKSIAQQIVDEGTGATVKGVKLSFINSLSCPTPPLPRTTTHRRHS